MWSSMRRTRVANRASVRGATPRRCNQSSVALPIGQFRQMTQCAVVTNPTMAATTTEVVTHS